MVTLNINGRDTQVDADPSTPILWALRDNLNMTGTKFGCGAALCGACTVHLNGAAIRSCITPISAAAGQKDHHHRSDGSPTRSARPCRTPGSSTTCRNAATARAAR
jgi:ferredoxin